MIPFDRKSFFYDKNYNYIGKKFDFNEGVFIYNNENKNNYLNNFPNIPNPKNDIDLKQNIIFQQNYNNKVYNNINNINNNLINQNNINIINNNVNCVNQNNKLTNRPCINNLSNNNLNNNIKNLPLNINMKPLSTRNKCTCSKTGCKKKYCACFSMGRFCEECDCKDCENKPIKENPNNNIINNNNILVQGNFGKLDYSKNVISNPKEERVICNCTKSNCMKKYCECYKQGFNCNSLCRCIECKNKKYNYSCNYISNENNNFYNYTLYNNINNNININNNFSHVHDFSISYIPDTFGKSIDYNNPINFQAEAFCIYIYKNKLKMEERNINLNIVNNNIINNNGINIKNVINNNPNDLNETPKFSNKKRLRSKNEDSDTLGIYPTTSNGRRRRVSYVNKNIKKKKLKLS